MTNKFVVDKENSCQWELKMAYGGDYYATECGQTNQFMFGDVQDNEYVYCPYCGSQIEVVSED